MRVQSSYNMRVSFPSNYHTDPHQHVQKKGKRYSLPNSRIMIHQPLGGAQGQAADIEIQANEIMVSETRIAFMSYSYTRST